MAKKKKTAQQITSEFERAQVNLQNKVERTVNDLYSSTITQIAAFASIHKLPEGVFTLSKLKSLENRIDVLIQKLNDNVEVVVRNGIKDAWQLSNDKNNIFADIRLDKSLIPADRKVIFYDPNEPALKAFQEREVNGLNLSERIYKTGEVFKQELETGIGLGIAKGEPAAELGRNLRSYLKNPDKLFRRVRNEEGELQLSKAAKEYHPGQGVYRSSRANIERLTRTEINTAFRTSDNERWKNMPFVLGQEIRTSGSHPKYDICDELKGDYPVEFIFIGFHPQCLCYSVTKLMTDGQFKAYQKLVLDGEDTKANIDKIAGRVLSIPEGAQNWLESNKERLSGWKNLPLFWQQNTQYMPAITPQA